MGVWLRAVGVETLEGITRPPVRGHCSIDYGMHGYEYYYSNRLVLFPNVLF